MNPLRDDFNPLQGQETGQVTGTRLGGLGMYLPRGSDKQVPVTRGHVARLRHSAP